MDAFKRSNPAMYAAEKPDAMPYDPNSGTLANIGRFMASNAAKDQGMAGMMPAAGSIGAVARGLAPEAAEAGLGAAARETPSIGANIAAQRSVPAAAEGLAARQAAGELKPLASGGQQGSLNLATQQADNSVARRAAADQARRVQAVQAYRDRLK